MHSPSSLTRRTAWATLGAAFVAIVIHFAYFALIQDLNKPLSGDAIFYSSIADNLAHGKPYVDRSSFWPNDPTTGRLPLWPSILATSFSLFPTESASQPRLVRLTGSVINVINSALIVLLTLAVVQHSLASAFIAGLMYAAHPMALYVAGAGLSEGCFVLVVLSGLTAWFQRNPKIYIGSFFLGLACLARAEFILIPVTLFCLLTFIKRFGIGLGNGNAILCFLFFFIPPTSWILRNYFAIGHFPVLSSIVGETFYGGNNLYVANNLDRWGYWIFPDYIPGETPKRTLALSMSEYEVSRYYLKQGLLWLSQHPLEVPRLVFGKLVRAYVTIPWDPSPVTYVGFLYRFVIYAAFLLAIVRLRGTLNRKYLLFIAAVFVTNFITVVLFYGCARFSFIFEPLLFPLAASLIARPQIGKYTH